MTQRERQTPDARNGPVVVPPARGAGLPVGSLPSSAPSSSMWEALFLASPPARRAELLARARGQGILYSHQLPDVAFDVGPSRSFPAAALLNGHSRELPSARPPADLVPHDADLDTEQREAVVRALHTPDVCLIAGVAGSGKSRVVAEILSASALRGERVLFLAPRPAALDHVLAGLARRETVCPVRCLGPDETPDSLPAEVRGLLLDARVRHFRDHTVPEARAAAVAARRRLEGLRREAEVHARLARIAVSRAAVAARLEELDARQVDLFRAITAEAREARFAGSPYADELTAANRERDEEMARLDACQAAVRAEQEKTGAALDSVQVDEAKLQSQLKARIGFRFWSISWWRGQQQTNLGYQLEQLRARRTALEADAASQTAKADVLAREHAEAEAAYRGVLGRVVDAEIARRSAELEQSRVEPMAEAARLAAEWAAAVATLEPASRPSAAYVVPDANSQSARAKCLDDAEASLAVAERWASAVEEALSDLPSQLAAAADIVAATTAAIDGEPFFGERAPQFDLLVFEEADRITETEFLRASRRARRWVLVGETTAAVASGSAGRALQPAALRAGFFQRLWENLHADPSRLPYSWERLPDGRLCCQLRAVPQEERSRLETESVADRPDIELRIAAPPRGAPELAEVVFPAGIAAADAKTYLFKELEELAVQSRGRNFRWSEEPDRLLFWLDVADTAILESVAIAPGVCELIGPCRQHTSEREPPFLTYALAFDRAAGWTRERAEDWVAHHALLRDSGRTVYLHFPRRMRPGLARFVTGLLAAVRGDFPAQFSADLGDAPAVEFVPVPSLVAELDSRRRVETDSRRRSGGTATAPRLRAVKGGAGLETELGAARRPDVIPSELRDALPEQGLVNYLEARAVVHDLEALATDPVFRDDAERWSQSECGRHGRGPAIAVIALYAAQAELIRQLVSRVPALIACPLAIEIGTPDRFQQRECLAALVSLTRSHSHRPVSFGEGPRELALAFTRARARLLLFGDAGTLVRRCQCADPVDHLDQAAADSERGLIAHLVACIQGHGQHAAAFRLRQGTGT
jgi:hypothetical protein